MSVPFEPVRKITIALPGELVEYADGQARRSRTNRSQVIGQALAQARARDQELLASQGYRFYAGEAAAFAEAAQAAVAEAWGDPSPDEGSEARGC